MIEFSQLEKYYPHASTPLHALKNINLHVERGEIVGVIGKSGAGKSTLLRCTNLLEQPTSGSVRVAGQDLTALSTADLRVARRNIGMIFQHFNLLNSANVFDNIALPLKLAGYDRNHIKTRVHTLLELTELSEKHSHSPTQLSGGQKQRVAIARALACNPQVLLCDEATSALDPQTTKSILHLLLDINRKLGLTILLITHEMGVIKEICDRVAVLDQGEIIEQTSSVDFFIRPQTSLGKTFAHSSLNHELPEEIRHILHETAGPDDHPVLRIFFNGEGAAEPIISHLIMNLKLEINILQANLEFIKGTIVGIMVFEVISNQTELPQGIQYLQDKGLIVEVIGYVKRDIHRII